MIRLDISQSSAYYLVVLVFALVVSVGIQFLGSGVPTGYAIYNDTAGTTDVWECGNITEPGTYTLNESFNTTETCIRIFADNVTLDFAGFNISGDGSGVDTGIDIAGFNNTIISNGYVYDFRYGIDLSENSNNTITNMTTDGIRLNLSSFNIIQNSTSKSDTYGIRFYSCENNTIQNINISSNIIGIYLDSSSNNIFNNITMNHPPSSVDAQLGIYIGSGSNNTIQNSIIKSRVLMACIRISSSSNNTIQRNTLEACPQGVYLSSSSDNTIQNNTITSNTEGLYIWTNSMNNTIQNNNISLNQYGIHSFKGLNNIIQNNTITSNNYGIYLDLNSSNTIQNNTITSNSYGIYNRYNSNNTIYSNIFRRNGYTYFEHDVSYHNNSQINFTSNQLWNNLNTISEVVTNLQEEITGNIINFNISMKYLNGSACPTCDYYLSLYPSESQFNYTSANEILTVNFTPTKVGIYSLKSNITDKNNNSEIRKHVFLINSSKTVQADYYFREQEPTNGHQVSNRIDSGLGSLISEKPVIDEIKNDGSWVQFNMDELPEYLFGSFKQINYSMSYFTVTSGVTGIGRYTSYSTDTDYNTNVSGTAKTSGSFNFSINWTSDYFWSSYLMSIKLYTLGAPIIYADVADPSYTNITYEYSNTPAITYMDNNNIQLLHATMNNNESTSADITIEGIGNTTMLIQMPVSGDYTVNYDSIVCSSNDDCTINSNTNGLINLTVATGSEHDITIEDATPLTTTSVTPTTESPGSNPPTIETTESTETTTVTTADTTTPPITTVDLEDVDIDSADMISWPELYEMIAKIIPDMFVESPKSVVVVKESSREETLASLKSADDDGIVEMSLVSKEGEVATVDCSNAVVCRWIKQFTKEQEDIEYKLVTISATGAVTEKAFDIIQFGHPDAEGLTGEKLVFGIRMSVNWILFLIVLIVIFYLVVRTGLHILKKKKIVKIKKKKYKHKVKKPRKLFKPSKK